MANEAASAEIYEVLARIFRERGYGWVVNQVEEVPEGGLDDLPERRLITLLDALIFTLREGLALPVEVAARLTPKGGEALPIRFDGRDDGFASTFSTVDDVRAAEVHELIDQLDSLRAELQ